MVGGGGALSGAGNHWGRKRVEKEDPHLLGRIREDLPQPRFLPAARQGQLVRGWFRGAGRAGPPARPGASMWFPTPS